MSELKACHGGQACLRQAGSDLLKSHSHHSWVLVRFLI